MSAAAGPGPAEAPAVAALKRGALGLLRHMPGRVGREAGYRLHWRGRAARAAAARARFERDLAALGPDAVCLDLGANIGEMTARMAARAGTVHAFEPDPWAFARLEARCAGMANVVLHRQAVGAAPGRVTLRRAPGFAEDPAARSLWSSVCAELAEAEQGEAIAVEQVGLADLLRGLGQPVALAKIDIEGAEVALLEALLDAPERARIGAIYVETHEWRFPGQAPRVAALRARAAALGQPRIDFDWV
ncbi:hypothetical protein LNKW23_04720 [Paralimibaculum aggregatum]|uniref:Methyltransferase FkbM domain-containing protein n=1 Tax=Paralimibaculum aggregatum TaxID=3036245 RepID=A0ABQ6LD18_9RHOB|nr:FkbM family methyltransferase [Limibaculum sp. NKW23]GMG81259.1 hypothetical protein LNKW23_04720 [Limibaculum sp. NKW23]